MPSGSKPEEFGSLSLESSQDFDLVNSILDRCKGKMSLMENTLANISSIMEVKPRDILGVVTTLVTGPGMRIKKLEEDKERLTHTVTDLKAQLVEAKKDKEIKQMIQLKVEETLDQIEPLCKLSTTYVLKAQLYEQHLKNSSNPAHFSKINHFLVDISSQVQEGFASL